jgi:hypothetical protein
MAVAAKKQPKPDLGVEVARLQADLLAFLEEKVATLKNSRDGAGLPIETLRHQLARGENCLCRIVDRLLNE